MSFRSEFEAILKDAESLTTPVRNDLITLLNKIRASGTSAEEEAIKLADEIKALLDGKTAPVPAAAVEGTDGTDAITDTSVEDNYPQEGVISQTDGGEGEEEGEGQESDEEDNNNPPPVQEQPEKTTTQEETPQGGENAEDTEHKPE